MQPDGRIVIVVDDALPRAHGVRAALEGVRRKQPGKSHFLAVPVSGTAGNAGSPWPALM